MEIYRCYELFLTDRKIGGCSEATLQFYEYVIGKFLRFIEENDLDSSVEHNREVVFIPSGADLKAVPLYFACRSLSVTPRIHRRLAQDIRHRYRRYRPSDPVSLFPARPRRLVGTGALACAVAAVCVVYGSHRRSRIPRQATTLLTFGRRFLNGHHRTPHHAHQAREMG